MKVPVRALSVRILAEGLIFGEAPRWHDDCIWASDMLGGRVVSVDHSGRLEQRAAGPSGGSGRSASPLREPEHRPRRASATSICSTS